MGVCSKLLDSCTYTTPRVVTIKDFRLGLLYYSLILAIFCYVVIYTLVVEQRYRLKAVDLVGSTRLQLRTPDPRYYIFPNQTVYCGNSTITYDGFTFQQYPCKYWDQYDSVDPFLEQGAMFIATRVTETTQMLPANCVDQSTPTCTYVTIGNPNGTTFFVGNTEYSTLLVDFTASSGSLGVNVAASGMPGKIVDQDGNSLNPCDDYAVRGWPCESHVRVGVPGTRRDVMPIATLLRAAGINSLDDVSPAIAETHRYAGLILSVSVQVSNFFADTHSFSEATFAYTYSVQAVQNAEFKAEQVLPEPGSGNQNRTIVDRHGIRLLVRVSGNVGVWDTATALVSLTSSLGLLAVAALVVDFIATRCMPLKRVYQQYKGIQSVDFPRIRWAKEEIEHFDREDLVNPPPRFLRRLGLLNDTTALLGTMEVDDADRLGPLVSSASGVAGSGRNLRRHDDHDDDDHVRAPISDRDLDHGADGTIGFEYSPPLAMSPQMQYTVAARALARATPMPTERLGRTSFGGQQSFYGMPSASGGGGGGGGGGSGGSIAGGNGFNSGASVASGSGGGGGTSIVVTSDDRRGGGSQIFVVSGGGGSDRSLQVGGGGLGSATGPRASFSTAPASGEQRRGSGISLTSQQARPLPVSRQASGILIAAPGGAIGAVPYVGFRPPMDSIASAGGETVDSDA